MQGRGILGGKTVTQVAAGAYFTLALCSDGTLAAWGDNRDGTLGNGTNTSTNVPVPVNMNGVLKGKTVTRFPQG